MKLCLGTPGPEQLNVAPPFSEAARSVLSMCHVSLLTSRLPSSFLIGFSAFTEEGGVLRRDVCVPSTAAQAACVST